MEQNQELRQVTLPAAVGAALICMASAVYAQDSSKITSVTLYPGSATVERTARVTPGMTRLEISGLPANFDPQTLRVDASPGVQIGEVSTEDVARTTTSNPREARLEEQIQALRDRQAALDGDITSGGMVTEFLSRLGAPSSEGKPAPVPDAASLAGVVELIRRGSGESLSRVRRARVEKRELSKQIAALERDLARLKSGTRDTRTIVVGVSAERPGQARVSYQVNGAGWRPVYRASLDSAASTVELLRQGIVSQTTGEDWNGVRLKLSTGQPRLSPQGPDPRPWFVSIFAPRPEARALSGAMNLAAQAPAALKRELRDQLEQTPIEMQTTFSTEFGVPGLVSLPSDGRKVTVSLAKVTLPAKMRLRVVPRLDPAAIVTAEAKRPEGVWLPGEVQLQRDGSAVGSTHWNPQGSGELLLPFGRDDRVRVTFGRVKDRNGATGLIDRRNEREVNDVLTLTSFHNKPLDLLVIEASPVSTSDRIDVRASFDPKPQIENWEERQGVVAWERSIAPKETVKIALNYAITYPRDAAVAGLP
ncbi:MAG: DUF4139 domain-containing protein [Burkholderiales bacterium]